MPQQLERLQKFLARCGVASRRKAELIIKEGRVCVNGIVVTELGSRVCGETDVVEVDGQRVHLGERCLLLFHKPFGVISTCEDPFGRRCVADYVTSIPQRVYPIGRLDRDVAGLLLLTNDGEYADRMLHPRNEVKRVYRAVVSRALDNRTLRRLRRGVTLDDGQAAVDEVRVLKGDAVSRWLPRLPERSSVVELTLHEGRNHLVKRLLAEVGHPVRNLFRISFGPYYLGGLELGEIQELPFRRLVPHRNLESSYIH